MPVHSKITTFKTERDTGVHRLNTSTIVNVDNFMGTSDKLYEVNNLNNVDRYTTVLDAVNNGNLIPVTSGSSGLSIYDEGVLLNNAVQEINFVGVDVMSQQDSSIPGRVDVYIPTPAYPSHYNTTDGNTNGLVPSVSTSNRYIAKPAGPRGNSSGLYNTNSWDSRTTTHPVIHNSTITYNNSADVLLEDELSIFNVKVLDADGSTVIAEHEINPVNANTSSSNNGISISVSNYGATSDKFKARFSVSIDLSTIIPYSGRITTRITHSNGTDYIKEQELFYDSESNTISINTISIQEDNSNRIIKYLSGIKYYNYDSPFQVHIDDIDNLNGDSYPYIQMHLTADNFGLSPINIHDNAPSAHDLTDWANDYNDDNDTYTNNNWRITAHDYCFIGDGIASTYGIDWSNTATVDSAAYPILVNTWGSESDELSEYFLDEDYRLMSDFSTTWDSTQDLNSYDSSTGVQTICGRIKVPGTSSTTNNNNPDFSTSNPGPNPDYTGNTGNRYYRKFTDTTNNVRSSCTLHIEGFTLDDLKNNRVELWINIPGRFNTHCPVHSSSEYNFSTFDADLSTGSNGPYPTGTSTSTYDDALRVNSSTTNDINVSFGNNGLDSSHNFFELEVIINDDSIEILEISVTW